MARPSSTFCAWLALSSVFAACSLDRASSGPDLRDAALGVGPGGSATAGFSATSGTSGHEASGTTAGTMNSTGNGAGHGSAGDATVPDGSAADGGASLDAATSSDAAPHGYVPGETGAPCTAKTDCELDRNSRTCFTEDFFAPLLTLPGGYCGNLCDISSMPPCEPGATCITFPTFPPVLACMRACTTDSDCRVDEGYSCNKPFTSSVSVCSLRN